LVKKWIYWGAKRSVIAYADNIMVIGRTRVEIITKTAELITVAKSMGFEITGLT